MLNNQIAFSQKIIDKHKRRIRSIAGVMDNLHYRLIFNLGAPRRKKNKFPERTFQNLSYIPVLPAFQISYIFVLPAEIATIFEPKVVTISAHYTIMRKFANFVGLYFPHYTIFQPNFENFITFKRFFPGISF